MEIFTFFSNMAHNFVAYITAGALPALKFSTGKLGVVFMGFPLYVTSSFSLAALDALYLSCILVF